MYKTVMMIFEGMGLDKTKKPRGLKGFKIIGSLYKK